jgi:1-acyl-sn-glycerol-3-phosphate acyltransferase
MWLAAAGSLVDAVPPLRNLGFFAVRRGDPLTAARQLGAIGRSARDDAGRAIVFFPEGGHVRPGLRVPAERGAVTVARAAGAQIVPAAIQYEYFERARPFVYVRAAEPVACGRGAAVDMRALLDDARAALAADLLDGTGDYAPLVRRARHTRLVANVPLDTRRVGRSGGPLYRHYVASTERSAP